MKAHQILYTKQMILAKLNGFKTVTRRPIKPQPGITPHVLEKGKSVLYYEETPGCKKCYGVNNFVEKFCPYGTPGDQLYSKENFEILDYSDFEQAVQVKYKADGHIQWVQLHDRDWDKYKKWKQPTGRKSKLFMFKTLSRFWDEVIEIKVERIQDITAEEVWNEGIRIVEIGSSVTPASSNEYRALFYKLWQSMYEGEEFDWNNNPWVWVVRNKPIIVNGSPAGQTANVKGETAKVEG